MDCCSTASYMDYRHHSMNSNFCYPYSPSMLRSASPYPLAGPGAPGSARYGGSADSYRSSTLAGYAGVGGYGDGYEKYYGAYHHHHQAAAAVAAAASASSAYPSGYYGNYSSSSASSSSYRESYGPGYGHYYHQSQSPYARAAALGGPASYGGAPSGSSSGGGGYLYPGARHYPSASPLGHPFGREAYSYHHHAREHPHHHQHQQQQYSSFANYGSLPSPYHRNGPSEHLGGTKSQAYQHLQQGFSGGHGVERGGPEGPNGGPAGSPPGSAASLYSGYSPSPTEYALPSSSSSPYGAGEHSPPQHPRQHDGTPGEGAAAVLVDESVGEHPPPPPPPQPPSSDTPAPQSQLAMLSATGEFPLGATKDTRMRKPKERKLQRGYGAAGGGGGGSGRASRNSSPTGAANGASGNGAATRMKSLDALTNLCWPEGEQFPTRMRKYSNANGFKSKDAGNSRKETNGQDSPSSTASTSPRGVAGAGRRTKKQTAASGGRQAAKEAKSAPDGKEKPPNGGSATSTPPVENKHVTPLPGFQQAFGSTEIGKFSEVFFNSSPTPADGHSPAPHHPMHHREQPHHQEQQQQHQHQEHQEQDQQPAPRPGHGRHGTSVQQLLAMDTLGAYESDVDTLSPQPWDGQPRGGHGAGDGSYEATGGTGYNLQIGTSFHPAYYESPPYSDHAVDSPLGNYFSEMTCNEFVN